MFVHIFTQYTEYHSNLNHTAGLLPGVLEPSEDPYPGLHLHSPTQVIIQNE